MRIIRPIVWWLLVLTVLMLFAWSFELKILPFPWNEYFAIAVFFLQPVLLVLGIIVWRKSSGKEKWPGIAATLISAGFILLVLFVLAAASGFSDYNIH